jgi:hypothetical protein
VLSVIGIAVSVSGSNVLCSASVSVALCQVYARGRRLPLSSPRPKRRDLPFELTLLLLDSASRVSNFSKNHTMAAIDLMAVWIVGTPGGSLRGFSIRVLDLYALYAASNISCPSFQSCSKLICSLVLAYWLSIRVGKASQRRY